MRKSFPYFEKEGYFYPIIQVTLKRGSKQIAIKALVDSGASFSIFQPELAEFLGIKINSGKKIYLTGIGGRIAGFLHRLNLTISSKTFPIKAIFSNELNVSLNLLGRNNFFQPFIVSFIESKKKTVISTSRK